MNFKVKSDKYRLKAAAIFVAALFVFPVLAPAEIPAVENKSKQLGDTALKEADYDEAIVFYRRFKADSASNAENLKTAYIALITSYIKGAYPALASRELDEFIERFPESNLDTVSLFRADILMLNGNSAEAAPIYKELISGKDNAIRLYAIQGFAFSLMQEKKWTEASEMFSSLENSAETLKLKWSGFKGKIFCMIMEDKTETAEKELSQKIENCPATEKTDMEILSLMLSVQKGNILDLSNTYERLRKKIGSEPYPLLYMTVNFIAGKFLKKKDFDEAIKFLKEAFIFAPSDRERKSILKIMINVYVSAGLKDKAISAAERYLEYFKESKDINDIKLQTARLYHDKANNPRALRLYSEIMDDSQCSFDMKFNAAVESANIHITDKRYDLASENIKYIIANTVDREQKSEGELLMAQIYFIKKEYARAASEFEKAADMDVPNIREKALYWLMRSYIEMNNLGKALEVSEKILSSFKEGKIIIEAAYYHADILNRLGREAEAEAEFVKTARAYKSSEFAELSLFQAGKIAFDNAEYSKASSYFSELISRYPNSTISPNALYKKLCTEYSTGNENMALESARMLIDRYSSSEFAPATLFWLIDYYREKRLYEKASATVTETMEKYKDNPLVSAQALYESANISIMLKDYDKALASLKELNEKFQQQEINTEGLYLTAEILSEKGDYSEAIKYYKKAAERRPASPLETACTGRIGDCDFALYSKSFQKEYIEEAISSFDKILEKNHITPDIRNQTIYKLGKCYETLDNIKLAIGKYRELIYTYKLQTEKGLVVDKIWIVKAIHSAISIYMKIASPEAMDNVVKAYKMLIKVNPEMADEYQKIIETLRNKYKVQL
ncbi:MAG: hypothetical protein A2020_14205 [Lentisphaerae bacterium GWF2_45_14]|nr:MAG: hypothetical protein A2020_14205 [Lentisphaerae bacterium GWF2_45_14]